MPKLKYPVHITSKQLYEVYADRTFRERRPGFKYGKIHHNSKYYLERNRYKTLLGIINKAVMKVIIEEAFECNLGARLGVIVIKKRKVESYIDSEGNYVPLGSVDWELTYKLWNQDAEAKAARKYIRRNNDHTQNYIAKFNWLKNQCIFKNKSVYSFKPCRTAKQDLKNILINPDRTIDYYITTRFIKYKEK